MDISSHRIGEKRKSCGQMEKGKKKKYRAKELFYSDDNLASVSEDLASSHSRSMKSDDLPSISECILELEETGKVKRQSSLHLFTISFLMLRKNRAGFVACQDAGTKYKWILFNFTNWSKCNLPLP
ncbi:Hypothetical predicted protein [Olea europaea subsp. europaea]|uniref:Uncharacterized protein n=1 Tax=Olea europaea subsp. europaea TaxID=158383 RepID=A0A8S0S4G5_OLEEU|nr:Hypothetical predicted protein [Olea europaea subsp. europaea]